MNHPELLIVLFIVLLILAGAAFLLSRASRRKTGLPEGRLHYSDTGAWRKVEKPYYDPEWGLAGKPDYVVEVKGVLVPVEVKSNNADQPYDSHIMQLAAYCRLVHVTSGLRPPHGLIKYNNRVFEIEYTPTLEASLKSLVGEVRSCDPLMDLARSHNSAYRCRSCGYARDCEQRLDTAR
jgi:RecB family exonuclease